MIFRSSATIDANFGTKTEDLVGTLRDAHHNPDRRRPSLLTIQFHREQILHPSFPKRRCFVQVQVQSASIHLANSDSS